MKLTIKPVGELFSEVYPAVNWIWDKWIPDGALVLLSAFMKVGKTTLAYGLIKAIAKGEPFLGYATRKTGILILAIEEHPREVRNRLERFGVTADDPIYVHTGYLTGYRDRDDEASEAELYKDLKKFCKYYKVELIVIDTLSHYMLLDNENDNAEVTRALAPLLSLARDCGISVLMIHHDTKGSSAGGRSIRGAGAFLATVDQAILLGMNGSATNGQRKISVMGRFPETPVDALISCEDRITGEFRMLQIGSEDKDELLSRIEDFLALAGEPKTSEEISKGITSPPTTVAKLLAAQPESLERSGEGVRGNPYRYKPKVGDLPRKVAPSEP